LKILELNQYEDKFLNYCKQFYNSADRNREWFNPNLAYSVVNRYHLYPYWTFLVDDNEDLIAMSCIQTHFFPDSCARVLTRTYYHPNYRRHHLAYEKQKTPAMFMLEKQLEWIDKQNISNVFFSVEYLRRKSSITKLSIKLKDIYFSDWRVLDDLYQTYPNDEDKNSWQSVCVRNGSSKLPLKSMPVNKWRDYYG
jgi:hypothetical protein